MGQENNTGDTNAGSGGNSNSGGTNEGLTEEECVANKTFYETYGLYPGTYDFTFPNLGDTHAEINANGICTFERNERLTNFKSTSIDVDLNTKHIVYNTYYNNDDVFSSTTGTFSKFDFDYSNKNRNKNFSVYYKPDNSSSSDDRYFVGYLPKEAFKLGGHEDCSGFRTENQDFITLNGLEHGQFTVNNDENQKLIISENRIEYIDSTSTTHLIYDFVSETVYNSNTGKNSNIYYTNVGHYYDGKIKFEIKHVDCKTDSFPFALFYLEKTSNNEYTITLYSNAPA